MSIIPSEPRPCIRDQSRIISTSGDLVQFFKKWAGRRQESFLVMSLTIKLGVIRVDEISRGTNSETLVHPREVFFPAITNNASFIVTAHNHPSGDVTPSAEDHKLARILANAGKILRVTMVDFIIFNKELEYFSFLEHDSPLVMNRRQKSTA